MMIPSGASIVSTAAITPPTMSRRRRVSGDNSPTANFQTRFRISRIQPGSRTSAWRCGTPTAVLGRRCALASYRPSLGRRWRRSGCGSRRSLPQPASFGGQHSGCNRRALVKPTPVLAGREVRAISDTRTSIEVMGRIPVPSTSGHHVSWSTHRVGHRQLSRRKVVMRDGSSGTDEPVKSRLHAPEALAQLDEEQRRSPTWANLC